MKEKEIKTVGQVMNENAAKLPQAATVVVVENKKKEQENKTPTIADKLQQEIKEKQKELQNKLKELAEKQKLNDARSKFLEALDSLENVQNNLDSETEFETRLCRLTFSTGEYSREEICKLSNTKIIRDFIDFIKGRIKIKISEIETELIK